MSMQTKINHNTTILSRSQVASTKFYMMGDDDVKKQSNETITTKALSGGNDNKPVERGPYSLYLGPSGREWDCKTCFKNSY